MKVNVRLSGKLASTAGRPRLQLELGEGAQVGDLLALLGREQPGLAALLGTAVPVIGGQHVGAAEPLREGVEVALLLPIAGG